MRNKVALLLAIILFLSLSRLLESKEVGDVVYYSLSQMWGGGEDQYEFSERTGVPGYIGHTMIYIGTDEDGNDYIIHAPGGTQPVKLEKRDLSGYVKYLNIGAATVTKEQRRKLISFANSKKGCPYATPYQYLGVVIKPTLEEQKGYNSFHGNECYTCIGIVERSYEVAQVGGSEGPTPNGFGRDLVRSDEVLFNNWNYNWNSKEGSYVRLLTDYPWPYNELDGWVLFPYTQWYEQTHSYHPALDSERMVNTTSDQPDLELGSHSNCQISNWGQG